MYYWRSSRETPHQAAARGPAGPTRCIGRYGRWYSALYSVLVRGDSSSGGGGGGNRPRRPVWAGLAPQQAVPSDAAGRESGLEAKGATPFWKRGHSWSEQGPPHVRKGAAPCQKRSHTLGGQRGRRWSDKGSPLVRQGVAAGQTRGHSFSRRGPPLFSPEAAPLGVRGPYLV